MTTFPLTFCPAAPLPSRSRLPQRCLTRQRGPRAAADGNDDPNRAEGAEPPAPDAGKEGTKPAAAAGRKPSVFETTIDDLTMKRMGRGSIYYGKRADPEDEPPRMPVFSEKPDPVVVAGATGRTGQWVALGLLAQGFNVRALTRSPNRAEKLFGPAGANLGVRRADLGRPESLKNALEGGSNLVCVAGAPSWLPGPLASSIETTGLVALIRAAAESSTIRRIVLVVDANPTAARARSVAIDALRACGVPYVVMRVASLNERPGGEREIVLQPAEQGKKPDGSRQLADVSRVDLAQTICQALVYDRSMRELQETDPEGEFDFPDCFIDVGNGPNAYEPDRRFWRRSFGAISAAFRNDGPVDDTEEDSAPGVTSDVSVQEDAQAGAGT